MYLQESRFGLQSLQGTTGLGLCQWAPHWPSYWARLSSCNFRLESLSFRDTVIGFLILLAVQVMFIAAVRMPHSVASSILVIAVIAGLPFISGASRSSAPKKTADSGDLTKATEPRDVQQRPYAPKV